MPRTRIVMVKMMMVRMMMVKMMMVRMVRMVRMTPERASLTKKRSKKDLP